MAWFVTWRLNGVKLLFGFFSIYLLLFRFKEIKEYQLEGLLFLSVTLFGVTSVLNALPSIGRFFYVSFLLSCSVIFLFLQKTRRIAFFTKTSCLWCLPILLYIIFEIRLGMTYLGLGAFLLNPAIGSWLHIDIALLDFYK